MLLRKYPKKKFSENQLFVGSMSLSLLDKIFTNELHVSTNTDQHLVVTKFHPNTA